MHRTIGAHVSCVETRAVAGAHPPFPPCLKQGLWLAGVCVPGWQNMILGIPLSLLLPPCSGAEIADTDTMGLDFTLVLGI